MSNKNKSAQPAKEVTGAQENGRVIVATIGNQPETKAAAEDLKGLIKAAGLETETKTEPPRLSLAERERAIRENADNDMLWPDQVAIIKLTHPRLFVRFNYPETLFINYEDWKNNHTDLQWLDPDDKPETDDEVEYILTDCWNFLALIERHDEEKGDIHGDI